MDNTKLQLLEQTRAALADYELDRNDSRNVLRFEKLAKLFLAISKQIAKEQPETKEALDL